MTFRSMVMKCIVEFKKANLAHLRFPLEVIEVVSLNPRLHFQWLDLTAEMIV